MDVTTSAYCFLAKSNFKMMELEWYFISVKRGYSSGVEHLTAVLWCFLEFNSHFDYRKNQHSNTRSVKNKLKSVFILRGLFSLLVEAPQAWLWDLSRLVKSNYDTNKFLLNCPTSCLVLRSSHLSHVGRGSLSGFLNE